MGEVANSSCGLSLLSCVERVQRLRDVGSVAIAGVTKLSESYCGDAYDGVQARRQQQ